MITTFYAKCAYSPQTQAQAKPGWDVGRPHQQEGVSFLRAKAPRRGHRTPRAEKRGFTEQSEKLIQIVTDGDNDLDRYVGELFPKAEHTIDVFHVVEYLRKAAGCLYKEGSDELADWIESMKETLHGGRASKIVEEIQRRLSLLPKRDPGSKSRRQRLESIRGYLSKRLHKMNYKSLRDRDLEISSDTVEGAVNYVIAKRFDNGGMRWIKDRSEALLQLRCIELNGDRDAFHLLCPRQNQ